MRNRFSTGVFSRHLQQYTPIYSFIMVLFIMGIMFGAILVNSLGVSQKEDLFYYLTQFFQQAGQGKMSPAEDLFKISFWHNVKFIAFMWILGISIIGFPLVFVLVFLKGVAIGFSVGFLVNQMGWNGLLLSFLSLLPQNLFFIPVYIFIAASSIGLSVKLIRKILMRQSVPFQIVPSFAGYALGLVAAIAVITIGASVESFISPALMKSILAQVGK